MSPDDFLKDSHVGDPQSWNKYAYVRNNPLRYIDPTGEKATVTTNCTTDKNNKTTCDVKITASIAIYAISGSNITQNQMNAASSTIKNQIEGVWKGSFKQEGVKYNVSTSIDVQVVGSEADGMNSGAQNVIGLSKGNAAPGVDSYVEKRSTFAAITGSGPDKGVWNIDTLSQAGAAHEFTHLLGVPNKPGLVLSNVHAGFDPAIPTQATAKDLGWRIREAIRENKFVRDIKRRTGYVSPSTITTTTVKAG